MVIAATVFWSLGTMFFIIAGFVIAFDDGFHQEETVERLVESWGVVRFLTLWALIVLIVAPLWPVALFTLWVVALIKGW